MGRWGIALAVWLMVPGRAAAQPCESLAPEEVAGRYGQIERTLRAERHKGRVWNHAWSWGLLAAAGGQIGAVYVDVPGVDCEPCLWVGAGKSLLGVGSTIIRRVRVETVPANPTPTCDDLADAERKLAAAAKNERVHWMRRVEGYAVNAAGLLYLGFGEDEWLDGTIGFGIGVIVGEIRLWTRPDGAIRALESRDDASGVAWTVAPLLRGEGFGLSVLGEF